MGIGRGKQLPRCVVMAHILRYPQKWIFCNIFHGMTTAITQRGREYVCICMYNKAWIRPHSSALLPILPRGHSQKNPCSPKATATVTGHLKLQTRSIRTDYMINIWSMEIKYLSNFPRAKKSDLKISNVITMWSLLATQELRTEASMKNIDAHIQRST